MATNVREEFKACLLDPDIAIPVAAFKTLTSVIKTCGASTMMELEVMLRAAADELKQCERDIVSIVDAEARLEQGAGRSTARGSCA